MGACPIRKKNIEDLLTRTDIVDGRRIVNRPLFNQLNEDVKTNHKTEFGLDRKDLPFKPDEFEDKNPNNTTETRLSNNRYSELYKVNEEYYSELQELAESKAKAASKLDFSSEEMDEIYDDELGQDPHLDDIRAQKELEHLIAMEKIKQTCKV